MHSDRSKRRGIRFLYCTLIAILYSCQPTATPPGSGNPISFSEDKVLVGPQGGHFVITTLNNKAVRILQVSNLINKVSKNWFESSIYYIQLDNITVRTTSKSNKIEISVDPADTLNRWGVEVQSGNSFGSFAIVQNGE